MKEIGLLLSLPKYVQEEEGCKMKKKYMKPMMKVYNFDEISLDKNIEDMSEEELLEFLKNASSSEIEDVAEFKE